MRFFFCLIIWQTSFFLMMNNSTFENKKNRVTSFAGGESWTWRLINYLLSRKLGKGERKKKNFFCFSDVKWNPTLFFYYLIKLKACFWAFFSGFFIWWEVLVLVVDLKIIGEFLCEGSFHFLLVKMMYINVYYFLKKIEMLGAG